MRSLASSTVLGILSLVFACSGEDGGDDSPNASGASSGSGGDAARGGSTGSSSKGGTSNMAGSPGDGGAAAQGGSPADAGAAGDVGAAGAAGTNTQGGAGQGGQAGASGPAGNPNTLPTISLLDDQLIEMDSSINDLAFTIGDAETAADELVVTKLSSNEAVVRSVEDVVLAGSGGNRTVTITPLPVFGETTITITVSDGELEASESFTLTVNSPPFIEVQPDVGTIMGYELDDFELSITDDLTASGSLLVSAISDNQTLLPDANIAISAGADVDHRKFTLTLAPGEFGLANVTITVEDEHGTTRDRTFKVTVLEQSVTQAELVSRSSQPGSVIGNGYSAVPSISSDGRYVAYQSAASNIAGTSAYYDIMVWDRTAEVVERASAGLGYNVNPSISANGQYVAFITNYQLSGGDTNGTWDVYVYDVAGNTAERVSVTDTEAQGDGSNVPVGFAPLGSSYRPAISSDGRYVAFISQSSNLVANDDNGKADVFVRDRTAGTTTRVSLSSSGVQTDADSTHVAMSSDGSVIAFASTATNLIDAATNPNALSDVFVRSAGATARLSLNPNNSALGNGNSDEPAVSGDGSIVAFVSAANNLISGDTYGQYDVFVYRLGDNVVERVSVASDASDANGYSGGPSLSNDGRYVVFDSTSTTLTGANNGLINVYVRDRTAVTTMLVNLSYTGDLANAGAGYTSRISADGNVIAFPSAATNIFLGDDNDASDVFVVPRP